MTSTEQERLAILETQMRSMQEQNSRMEDAQKEIMKEMKAAREDTRVIKEALAQGRGFRLGLLAALPLGGGAAGSFLTKWLSSGGPTGTH